MKKTVEMPLGRLPDLKLKLDKFSKRAAKLGLPPLTYTVERQYAKEGAAYGTVTVEGPAPVIPGWKLLAAVDRLEGDVVFLTVPGQQVEIEKWKQAGSYCDHCQTMRNRLRTYLLRETATGKEIQLGSTCVLEFTGSDLEGMFSFAFDWMHAVGDDWEMGGPPSVLWMESYLAIVAALIRMGGFVSRKKVHDEGGVATCDEAIDFMMGRKEETVRVTPADEEMAATTIKWARETLDPKSEYEHNLKVILGKESLPWKFMGFAASAIPAYQRFLADQQKRESDKNSQWVGEVKKRGDFRDLTVIFTKDFPGNFGTTTLLKFRDPMGNILVWFASAICEALVVDCEEGGMKFQRSLKAGDTISLKATVKAHETYGDIKQTVLTRGKLI